MRSLLVLVVACAVAALTYAWFAYTTWPIRLLSVAAAAAYGAIEATWYSLTTEDEDGEVHFTPLAATCRKPFTSVQQFIANCAYLPVALFLYRDVLPCGPFLRVLLFPLNIWVLEIVEGYAIMACHDGHNPAWSYRGDDAFFSGNIKLGHAHLWFGLGVVIEVLFSLVF